MRTRASTSTRSLAALAALALGCGLAGPAAAVPPGMSLAEYLQRTKAIGVEHGTARQACSAGANDLRERCLAEAIGREHVARADLEVAYRSTPRTRFEALEARADARFWVAREGCAVLLQDRHEGCLRSAKIAHVAARDDALARMKVEEAVAVADAICDDDAVSRKPATPACRARALAKTSK